MIVVITTKERNKQTGRIETIVSHGVNIDTGDVIVLPSERIEDFPCYFDPEMQEYVLIE